MNSQFKEMFQREGMLLCKEKTKKDVVCCTIWHIFSYILGIFTYNKKLKMKQTECLYLILQFKYFKPALGLL